MSPFLATVILVVSASLWGTPTHMADGYLPDYTTTKGKYEAWFNACVYTKYTCGLLKLPKVLAERMRPGLLGYYNGSDTIFIRTNLKGIRLQEVLMHEMIHYIQKQIGGLEIPGYAEPICRAEAEAFGSVDDWLRDEGYWNKVVGPDWWKPYKHCHEFYDPDFAIYGDKKLNINQDPPVYPTGRF